MEELLEKAAEDFEEIIERKYKLSVALSLHPDVDYTFQDQPELLLPTEEERLYGEANAKAYSLLLRRSLTNFHGRLNLFEENCQDPNYSFESENVKHRAYDKRTELEEEYQEIEDDIIQLSRLSAENFDLAVYGSKTTLEPVGTTPLNSLAD